MTDPDKKPTGRKTISQLELHVKAEELGVNPFEILLLMAKGDAEALGYAPTVNTGTPTPLQPKIRLQAAQEACKYMLPQLKSVEVTGDPNKPVEAKLNLIGSLVKEMEAAVRAGMNDKPKEPPKETTPTEPVTDKPA